MPPGVCRLNRQTLRSANGNGAGEGLCSLVSALATPYSAIEPHPRKVKEHRAVDETTDTPCAPRTHTLFASFEVTRRFTGFQSFPRPVCLHGGLRSIIGAALGPCGHLKSHNQQKTPPTSRCGGAKSSFPRRLSHHTLLIIFCGDETCPNTGAEGRHQRWLQRL